VRQGDGRGRARGDGADVGIAVTGVAGPGGGTERKPVGLVYLHVSTPAAERGQELPCTAVGAQVREVSAVLRCIWCHDAHRPVTLSRRPAR